MNHRKRTYLAQYLDLIDEQTNEQLGFIGDISDNGLMFITEKSISLNTIRDVRIENNVSSSEITQFSIKAQIKTLWEKPNLNPKLLCVGCFIIEIANNELQYLKKLMPMFSYDKNIEVHRTQHD
ncbi:hypothetical protein DOJK_01275 [Patescibacteria group bacterium]|nr:hypothetical protein DOJK_01275 [Patescibacteria group bacterium]